MQKYEYIDNEKSFLDEIKKIFIVFEGLSFSGKYKFDKKQRTQALNLKESQTETKPFLQKDLARTNLGIFHVK